MTTEQNYLVTVENQDGTSATSLHISSADEATKLRQIADDLGLVIDDHGFAEDDPEIRRITIRHAPDDIKHHH
jgi:hypothetical protein